MIMKPFEIEIPRVSQAELEALIKLGIIYIGDDDQIHVKENIPTTPASK